MNQRLEELSCHGERLAKLTYLLVLSSGTGGGDEEFIAAEDEVRRGYCLSHKALEVQL